MDKVKKQADWVLIRACMKTKGITDTKFAHLFGVTERTVNNWRSAENFPEKYPDTFMAISRAIGLNCEQLVKDTPENIAYWQARVEDISTGLTHRNARTNNAKYNGTIIEVNSDKYIQRWEDNGKIHGFVTHIGRNVKDGAQFIVVGAEVNISYKNGAASVKQLEAIKERNKDTDLER